MFIMDQSTKTESWAFFFFLYCPRDMADITIKNKYKPPITCVKKTNEKARFSVCVHMRFNYVVEISGTRIVLR